MFSSERNINLWALAGFCGQKAIIFETTDSTHCQMKARAVAGELQPGTLIVADQQTSGRGRHERTWASPAGKNLYFNLLLPLEGIPSARFAQITQVTALTFAEVFKRIQDEAGRQATESIVTVKWPNDILFGKSKFCGILAEIVFVPNAGQGKRIPALNLGVGINVNSDSAEYASLGRAVTTLREITGRPVNREKLLQALVASLERAMGQFRAFGITPWVEAWRKMDKFIGARGTVIVNNRCTDEGLAHPEESQKKTGCILDMQPDGSLLFRTDDGETITVYSADLEI